MKLEDSKFIKKYIKQMKKAILQIYPNTDKNKLTDIIIKEINTRFKNPKVILDNNYTRQSKESTLLTVIDWVIDNNPIIAGNGTLYKRHDQEMNPRGVMLNTLLKERSAFKKLMFTVDDFTSPLYIGYDNDQKNKKILANSYYGGSGSPTSSLYSKWSGPATTLTAQQIISTTTKTFEGFLADNYQFLNLTEFFDWVEVINKEKEMNWDKIADVSKDKLVDRILSKIIKKEMCTFQAVHAFVDNLTDNNRKKFYYKNNLMEFIDDHEFVKDLYRKIYRNVRNLPMIDDEDPDWKIKVSASGYNPDEYDSIKKWTKKVNHEYFMDPNHAPDTISDYVNEISSILFDYVYVRYLPFDRIYRMKNFKRKCVLIIDTDSNILVLDNILNYMKDNIMESSYDREKDMNTFIGVNTITNTLTKIVTDVLIRYGEKSNIPEEYRPLLNMKNEFFFGKLIIGKTKKRYIAKMILREGNLMKKPKTAVTGFDFIKSRTPKEMERFFMGLLDKYLLGEEIDVQSTLKEIIKFSDIVKKDLQNGGIQYLPINSAKPASHYKNPASMPVVRGMIVWDALYPDDPIELPSKPKILKLKINKESDLDKIKYKYPNEYEIILKKVFRENEFVVKSGKGIFTKYKKGAEGKEDKFEYKGCTVLTIPVSNRIPEWCMDYIDYDTIINNTFAPFKSVLEIFYIKNFTVGKTNTKSDKISNIIKF